MAQETHSGAFATSRMLPYRSESVFAAFETPEMLSTWWGPNGFTNTFELFEFREGGRWHFIMHGPDGSNYVNESKFIELIAPSRIVIQHLSQPHFVLTVTLATHEGGTELTWHQDFEDKELAVRIRHIVEPANEQNLDRLGNVLAQRG
ncbi:MAG TPA: SRPBCC domain-containing protein [Thermoanaerobaculia bacterium]|nr:SRPBCC domain-containing protein [Thermoanaerobaculia bacterium]